MDGCRCVSLCSFKELSSAGEEALRGGALAREALVSWGGGGRLMGSFLIGVEEMGAF